MRCYLEPLFCLFVFNVGMLTYNFPLGIAFVSVPSYMYVMFPFASILSFYYLLDFFTDCALFNVVLLDFHRFASSIVPLASFSIVIKIREVISSSLC